MYELREKKLCSWVEMCFISGVHAFEHKKLNQTMICFISVHFFAVRISAANRTASYA